VKPLSILIGATILLLAGYFYIWTSSFTITHEIGMGIYLLMAIFSVIIYGAFDFHKHAPKLTSHFVKLRILNFSISFCCMFCCFLVIYFICYLLDEVDLIFSNLTFNLLFIAINSHFGTVIWEEILFRGILQTTLIKIGTLLKNRFSVPLTTPAAIAIQALIFAYCHASSHWQQEIDYMTFVLTTSIIFGILAVMTNNLWASIGAHLAVNVAQTIAFGSSIRPLTPTAGILLSIDKHNLTLAISLVVLVIVFVFVIFGCRALRLKACLPVACRSIFHLD
jgi:membrane protease YdiL (CAAX protease family)